MKIALFDPYGGKFTIDMQEWWKSHGHEVIFDRYYDPEKVDWADVVWFDTCDNNLLSATNPSQALRDEWLVDRRKETPWDLHEYDLTDKKVIVRPIDIEVWQGHHAYENMWDVVDDVIFLAPHIQDIFNADSRTQNRNFKQHVIPCGVDLNRWTLKKSSKQTNKVGIVAERWVSKGIDYAIQLAMMHPNLEFHWLGKNNDYHWEHEYLKDMVKRKCPNLILEEEFVDDLNSWWEDKDFVLSCSHKETFGYNIAEAMAKGVMPVIHHFFGAENIWPDYLLWDSLEEVNFSNIWKPAEVQNQLVKLGFTLPQMMEKIDAILTS